MLIGTDQMELTPTERIGLLLKNPSLVAFCGDTGAYLVSTYGRSKAGSGDRYILLVPPGNAEKDIFNLDRRWYEDGGGRRFLRAFSETEAIEAAQKKLDKFLIKRTT